MDCGGQPTCAGQGVSRSRGEGVEQRPLEENGAESAPARKAKTRNFGRAEAISSPRPVLEGWQLTGTALAQITP